MEQNYIVYKHTCKDNGKVYIGLTGTSLLTRTGYNGEGYLHKKKNGEWVQPQMARAILKHGWDNFDHEIVYEGLTKEEADEKEKELISFYDSRNPEKGYNTREGGSNGPLSEDTKEKLRETMVGRYDGEKIRSLEKLILKKLKGLFGKRTKFILLTEIFQVKTIPCGEESLLLKKKKKEKVCLENTTLTKQRKK